MFKSIAKWFIKDSIAATLSDAEIEEIESRPINLSVLSELRSASAASAPVAPYVDHDNWALTTNAFE